MYENDPNSPKRQTSPYISTANIGFESRTNVFTRRKITVSSMVNMQRTQILAAKPNANFLRVTKNQVRHEIDKISRRMERNKERDIELKNSLSRNEKRFLEKEEELQSFHRKQEKIWEKEHRLLKEKVIFLKKFYLIERESSSGEKIQKRLFNYRVFQTFPREKRISGINGSYEDGSREIRVEIMENDLKK